MTWGTYVRYYGTTDADTTHANDLLGKAVKYYDEYLALKDSNAVRVDKALCAYYQQDGTSALQQMKDLTASAPDYGPAWANLGMLYEASGDNDSAKAAYALSLIHISFLMANEYNLTARNRPCNF